MITNEILAAPKVTSGISEPTRGIPKGGTTDQVLAKNTDADYDVDWKNVAEASIPDNSITKAKLVEEVRDSLDLADSSVQPEDLSDYEFKVIERTGATVSFDRPAEYNSLQTPSDATEIVFDLTDSRKGFVQKFYHNDGGLPTFTGATVVKLNNVQYKNGENNIIFFAFAGGSMVEYWLVNEEV